MRNQMLIIVGVLILAIIIGYFLRENTKKSIDDDITAMVNSGDIVIDQTPAQRLTGPKQYEQLFGKRVECTIVTENATITGRGARACDKLMAKYGKI